MANDLLTSIDDGVATLTMNRPERKNALSPEMMAGLLDWLPKLASDSSVGAVIITGASDAFCAGGDVTELHAFKFSTPLDLLLLPSSVHQNASHRLSGSCKKMRAAVPLLI